MDPANSVTSLSTEPDAATEAARTDKAPSSPIISTESNTKSNRCGEREYLCEECPMILTSIYALRNHHRKHTGEKPFLCPICGKNLKKSQTLDIHMRVLHPEAVAPEKLRLVKCSYCPKLCPDKNTLRYHERVHTGERPYKCGFCSSRFTFANNRKQHEERVHKKVSEPPKVRANLNCEICSRRFISQTRLDIHLKIHAGKKPYKCDYCSKEFDHEITGKFAHELRNHANLVPDFENVVKDLKCNYCGKIYPLKHQLREHVRCHTGERTFACDVCGKTFHIKKILKQHFKTHAKYGLKPLKCRFCHDRYIEVEGLHRHEINLHNATVMPLSVYREKLFSGALHSETTQNSEGSLAPPSTTHYLKCEKCKRSYATKHCLNVHVCTPTHPGRRGPTPKKSKQVDTAHQPITSVPNPTSSCRNPEPAKTNSSKRRPRTVNLESDSNSETEEDILDSESDEDYGGRSRSVLAESTGVLRRSQRSGVKRKLVIVMNQETEVTTEPSENTEEKRHLSFLEVNKVPAENQIVESSEVIIEAQVAIQVASPVAEDIILEKATTNPPTHVKSTLASSVAKAAKKYASKHTSGSKHGGSTNTRFACDICGATFSRNDGRLRHVRRIHVKSGLKPFKCLYCNYRFLSIEEVRNHAMKHHHDVILITSLNECAKKLDAEALNTETEQNSQASTNHPAEHTNQFEDAQVDVKQILCFWCQQAFGSQSEADEHEKLHLPGENRFKCRDCHLEFSSEDAIARHCIFDCGKSPKGNNQILNTDTAPVNTTTNDAVDVKQIRCFWCPQLFETQSAADEHEKLHLPGENKLSCTQCRMGFSSKDALDRHSSSGCTQSPKKTNPLAKLDELTATIVNLTSSFLDADPPKGNASKLRSRSAYSETGEAVFDSESFKNVRQVQGVTPSTEAPRRSQRSCVKRKPIIVIDDSETDSGSEETSTKAGTRTDKRDPTSLTGNDISDNKAMTESHGIIKAGVVAQVKTPVEDEVIPEEATNESSAEVDRGAPTTIIANTAVAVPSNQTMEASTCNANDGSNLQLRFMKPGRAKRIPLYSVHISQQNAIEEFVIDYPERETESDSSMDSS